MVNVKSAWSYKSFWFERLICKIFGHKQRILKIGIRVGGVCCDRCLSHVYFESPGVSLDDFFKFDTILK